MVCHSEHGEVTYPIIVNTLTITSMVGHSVNFMQVDIKAISLDTTAVNLLLSII